MRVGTEPDLDPGTKILEEDLSTGVAVDPHLSVVVDLRELRIVPVGVLGHGLLLGLVGLYFCTRPIGFDLVCTPRGVNGTVAYYAKLVCFSQIICNGLESDLIHLRHGRSSKVSDWYQCFCYSR